VLYILILTAIIAVPASVGSIRFVSWPRILAIRHLNLFFFLMFPLLTGITIHTVFTTVPSWPLYMPSDAMQRRKLDERSKAGPYFSFESPILSALSRARVVAGTAD
jgi:hypothetical protein